MRSVFIGVLLALATFTSQAADPTDFCNGRDENIRGFSSLVMDSCLSPELRTQLKGDVQWLRSLSLVTAVRPTLDALVRLIFGGNTTANFIRYLDDRINLIIPDDLRSSQRMVLAHIQAKGNDGDASSDGANNEPKGVVMATNSGAAYWLYLAARDLRVAFQTESHRFPITSTRVGIMQLGPGYTLDRLRPLHRLSIFVHEARHSDCTGGIKRSVLTGINSNNPTSAAAAWAEYSRTSSCGHMHSACPVGHSLAGFNACDEKPWGAYTVDAIFNLNIVNNCQNCTEEDRQLALIDAGSSLGRLALTAEVQASWDDNKAVDAIQRMIRGEMGVPDMSSSGVLENQ